MVCGFLEWEAWSLTLWPFSTVLTQVFWQECFIETPEPVCIPSHSQKKKKKKKKLTITACALTYFGHGTKVQNKCFFSFFFSPFFKQDKTKQSAHFGRTCTMTLSPTKQTDTMTLSPTDKCNDVKSNKTDTMTLGPTDIYTMTLGPKDNYNDIKSNRQIQRR